MTMQEQHGSTLIAELPRWSTLKTKRSEIYDQLQEVFPPIVEENYPPRQPTQRQSILFNPGSSTNGTAFTGLP